MRFQATGATKPHSAEPAVTSPNRDDDQLLLLPEVAELKRTSEATERWLRNQGKAPYLFRSGRRVVAWKSDVLAHLEAERTAEQSNRAGA